MKGVSLKTLGCNVLLAVTSAVAMVVVGEVVLRFYFAQSSVRGVADEKLMHKYFAPDDTPLTMLQFYEEPLADRHINNIPLPEGVPRSWFRQSPSPVQRTQKDVSRYDAERYQAWLAKDLYGPQSFYIWNRAYAEQHVCAQNDHVFGNYGSLADTLRVFAPSNNSPYPRYRFPSNALTPSGLRTNRHGFRGPELSPGKDSKTIRIAFLGASTTVGHHMYPFSYPEHFGYWVNLWLEAKNYPFHVEIINAGREGVGSTDIAAIFEEEVLPLHPDYVIYYEGANQVAVTSELVRSSVHPERYTEGGLLPRDLIRKSYLARLVEEFYKLRVSPWVTEGKRPAAQRGFPDAIDEFIPDIRRQDLPLELSTILRDLRHIANLSQKDGARLLISSFIWLDGSESGLISHHPRHREIISQLNRVFWPLLPKDIRRLTDFQNRVLKRFADVENLGFLDIANVFPRDPDLFTDAIHFTPEGVRLQGWVALATFLPYLVGDLEQGFTPKSQSSTTSSPKSLVASDGETYEAQCAPGAAQLASARTIPLSRMALAYKKSSINRTPLEVLARSAPLPWAYISRLPLRVNCAVTDDRGWVSVDLRVLRGTIGVGVLTHSGDNFIVRHLITHRNEFATTFLPVASFKDVGDLIVQNGDELDGSEALLRNVRVIMAKGDMAECLVEAGD